MLPKSGLHSKIEAREAPGVQMHANQLTVAPETVRGLIYDQFPDSMTSPALSAGRDRVMLVWEKATWLGQSPHQSRTCSPERATSSTK